MTPSERMAADLAAINALDSAVVQQPTTQTDASDDE